MKKLLTLLFIVTLCSCERIATNYNTPADQNYATTLQLEKVAKADTIQNEYKKVVELDDVVYVFNQDNKLVMKINTQFDLGTAFFIALGVFTSCIIVVFLIFAILKLILD